MQVATEPLTTNPMEPIPFEVVGKRRETYDMTTIELAAPDGFSWRPG